MSDIVKVWQKKRVLSISPSGDYEFPFRVCPVDDDGIDIGIIAHFANHADAMLFVKANDIAETEGDV